MKKFLIIAAMLVTIGINLVVVPVAFAHPLGNFTINHYAGIRVSQKSIAVDFVLDMAEIPAFQEITSFDANGNGKPDPDEVANYRPMACAKIGPQLDFRLGGQALALHLDSSAVSFPPGAGGLSTLRLTCEFSTPTSLVGPKVQLSFADHSYADRIGWREIVTTADGVSLQGNYTSSSVSQRLTAYPKEMLSDPLNQRELSIDVLPVAGASSASSAAAAVQSAGAGASLGRANDAFTQLITVPTVTPLGFLLALLVAFVWGGLHAVTPGHGKTIVAAYLVGSRGTARHAFFLGLTTTITHTAGVFALGLITLFAERFIVPEKLYPWLSLLSGILVAAIGFWMLVVRARRAQLFARPVPTDQETVNDHMHGHREMSTVRVHAHPVHEHSHAILTHSHGGRTHIHDASLGHTHEHADEPTHSHLPPGAHGEAVTWRSILALGISGGILPCPSALIVLLSAIALGRIAFGLALVLSFSAGLAAVLSGIGIIFVYAGRLFDFSPKQSLLLRLLPLGSALVIATAGLLVAGEAVIQMGLVRL